MHALVLALVLAASGDIIVQQTCPAAALSAGQKTTLATIVTNTWPSIAVANVIALHCEKRDGGAACVPLVNEALDQNTLYSLVFAAPDGTPLAAGTVAGARSKDIGWTTLAAADVTSLVGLVQALCSGAANLQAVDFTQQGSTITMGGAWWGKPMSAAALFTAWSALTTGQSIVKLGVVP